MLEIEAAPPAARWMLCGDPAVAPAAGAAFGLSLPHLPCRAEEAGARAALWLGPGEWLLLAPDDDASLAQAGHGLAAALRGMAHSLVDVSDGFAALILRGEGAARALSAGCPLDLHPAAFPPGMVARTLLGRAGIILWRRGPALWRVETGRSLAPYARDFLTEAARRMPGF